MPKDKGAKSKPVVEPYSKRGDKQDSQLREEQVEELHCDRCTEAQSPSKLEANVCVACAKRR